MEDGIRTAGVRASSVKRAFRESEEEIVMTTKKLAMGAELLNALCDALGIDSEKRASKIVIEADAGAMATIAVTTLMRQCDIEAVAKAVKCAAEELG